MPIIEDMPHEVPWRLNHRKWEITRQGDGTNTSRSYSVIGVGAGAPLLTHFWPACYCGRMAGTVGRP